MQLTTVLFSPVIKKEKKKPSVFLPSIHKEFLSSVKRIHVRGTSRTSIVKNIWSPTTCLWPILCMLSEKGLKLKQKKVFTCLWTTRWCLPRRNSFLPCTKSTKTKMVSFTSPTQGKARSVKHGGFLFKDRHNKRVCYWLPFSWTHKMNISTLSAIQSINM